MSYLITYKDNWADEIKLKGYAIVVDEDVWNQRINSLTEDMFPMTNCVGSNQFIDYNSLQDYLDCITIKEISEEDAKTIIDCFARYDYERKSAVMYLGEFYFPEY